MELIYLFSWEQDNVEVGTPSKTGTSQPTSHKNRGFGRKKDKFLESEGVLNKTGLVLVKAGTLFITCHDSTRFCRLSILFCTLPGEFSLISMG